MPNLIENGGFRKTVTHQFLVALQNRYVPSPMNYVTRDGSFLWILYPDIIQFGRVFGSCQKSMSVTDFITVGHIVVQNFLSTVGCA